MRSRAAYPPSRLAVSLFVFCCWHLGSLDFASWRLDLGVSEADWVSWRPDWVSWRLGLASWRPDQASLRLGRKKCNFSKGISLIFVFPGHTELLPGRRELLSGHTDLLPGHTDLLPGHTTWPDRQC